MAKMSVKWTFCHLPYAKKSILGHWSRLCNFLRRSAKGTRWLPDIFNDFFDNSWMEKANYTAPAINVIETEKEYEVELAAPGLTKEDFQVHVDEDNNLVINMEKKAENNEKKHHGRYKIEAKVEHGVLHVSIPKKDKVELQKAVKQIEIQ